MSSTDGIKEQVLGQDLLAEHNMKPWWETLHGYLLATTITSSALMIYIVTPAQQVNCMPSDVENTTGTGSAFTESQTALVNGYCTGQIPWFAQYAGIASFVAATVILVASNIWLNHPDVIDAFRSFAKAETIINDLHSRSQTLNFMAITPVFSEEGEPFQLRKACLLLWTHRNKIRWHYGFRNAMVISMTILDFGATLAIAVLMGDLVGNPYFNCSLTQDLTKELRLTLDGSTEFFCSYNFAKITFPFVLLCAVALLGQIVALVFACVKLSPPKVSRQEKNTFSPEFQEAREYAHFMKVFWLNASPVDSERFEELLTFIFSQGAINSMLRFIPNAVMNVSTTKEENNFPPPYKGPKFRYIQTPNPDLTHVEMYVKLHRKGGNNALHQLFIMYQNDRRYGYNDIMEALGHIKLTHWDEEAKNFANAACQKMHWKLFVVLLNAACYSSLNTSSRMDCGVYDFKLDERENGKEKGRSILYYALHKDTGELEFNCTAAKHILACTKCSGIKYVYYDDKCVTATEFVKSEYEEDPTYSDELRDSIIALIEKSEQPKVMLSTTKT